MGRLFVVHFDQLEQVLVALLGVLLVLCEQNGRTLRELAGQTAVTGLVHQELLIAARGRLGVEGELLLGSGVEAEQVPVAALDGLLHLSLAVGHAALDAVHLAGSIADDEGGTMIGLSLLNGLEGLSGVSTHSHLSHIHIAVAHGDLRQGLFLDLLAGRGELQLGVLIETMRREGFELSISRPRVVFHKGENGEVLEPVDEVVVDVDEEFSGTVVEKLGSRRAELVEMIPSQAGGKVRLIFHAPTRGLIGYHSEFLTDTHGTGVMNRSFYDYEPFKGEIEGRRNGVLISSENGTAIAYSLWKLEDRGPMFIDPNVPVYVGMIIGEHTKPNDLEINPCRSKQLTNIRAAGKDEAISLTPPRRITLEEGLSYIQEDELLEVTPKTIRLRKRILDPILRKRSANKIA